MRPQDSESIPNKQISRFARILVTESLVRHPKVAPAKRRSLERREKMKKILSFAVLALLVLGVVSYSSAQIEVIGKETGTGDASGEVVPTDSVEPFPYDPDVMIGIDDPEIVEERWDPEAYYAELRALTLDGYADRIAENLLVSLENSGGKLLSAAEEYVAPTVEEIKANFYAQVATFEVEGAGAEMALGAFCDGIAESLAAKIALFNDAERRIMGIYYKVSDEDIVKNLSQQVIWTLESMTVQKFYDEFYSLMREYMPEPIIDVDQRNEDGTFVERAYNR